MSRKRYPRDTVFYGHAVSEPGDAPAQSAERVTAISPQDLDDFLGLLKGDGVITFDDGYLDNLTAALPILEKHARAATVFVTCGFIDGSHAPMERVAGAAARAGQAVRGALSALNITTDDPGERYQQICAGLKPLSVAERREFQAALTTACGTSSEQLTKDYLSIRELHELAQHPLITIGAHTLTHPDLRHASDPELGAELRDARARIEDWIEQPVYELAYPYGDTDQRVRQATAAAGYRHAFVVEQANWRSHLPRYGRFDIPRVDLSTATRRMRKHERKAAAATDR